jgi:hypothetical protein
LENKTYYSTNVTLAFDVNEPTSEMNYCLDGLNITLVGNTTLTQLSYGTHSLTVYATDFAGNTGASKTINFNIAREPQPFLIILVIASVTTVAGIGLIVYFKKRKR